MRRISIFCTSVLAMVSGCSQQSTEPAGTRAPGGYMVVVNARIWTGDPDRPEATALVINDGRFTYVGDDAGAFQMCATGMKTLDAGGKRLIPGLCDAHMHFISGGLQLARLNLRDVADRAEFIAKIAERAAACKSGEWVQGGRWSTESWPDPTQPHRDWIDATTGGVPVLLSRMDGHGALANSAALRIAGIDRNGPADPPGGEIQRDPATNEPTGILRDAAIGLVRRHAPQPSPRQIETAIRAAALEAHSHGLTSVHTMSAWSDVATLRAAGRSGRLPLRVRLYVSEDDWSEFIPKATAHSNDDWLRVVGFKQYMDGSLGSRTAYMAAPYADNPPHEPNRRGILSAVMQDHGALQAMIAAADAAGLDAAVHAIGDQANHVILSIYDSVSRSNGERPGRRMRIEHAQHLLPADIERFARLGVVASMQPLHKADDGRYAEQAIGSMRCRSSYAFRGLLDAGAMLAFGSDWPVVSLNPFLGMHAAVTGRTLDGKVFVPEQNITVEESLRAYTSGGAAAAGDQDRLGRIREGFLADFVILKDDVLTSAPDHLDKIRVDRTFVDGRRVWPES